MIKSLLYKKELYYSLAAEATAVAYFFYMQSFYQVVLLLLLHFIACMLMLPLILPLVLKRYKGYAHRVLFLLVSLSFLLFVLGYVFFLLVFVYLLILREKKAAVNIESFSLNEVLTSGIFPGSRVVGEDPLYLLKSSRGLKGEVVDLLTTFLLEVKNPRVLRSAMEILSSQYDELRLSVFSALTKLEKSIHDRISLLSEKLKEDSPEEDKANLLFELAQNYYDLVYYGLVDKELEKTTLQMAEDYLLQAMNTRRDAEFLVLMSKIQMAKGDLSSAERFLVRAGELNGLHPTRYIPYLTEIYFRKGQYKRVVELLPKHAEDLKYSMNPYLAYVCEFWTIDDSGPTE